MQCRKKFCGERHDNGVRMESEKLWAANRDMQIRKEKMKDRLNISGLGIGIVLLALAGTGCKSLTIPKYTGEVSKQARMAEVQGLAIVVDPIVEKERADTYFKVDPIKREIAILYLQAENKSTNCTWLLTEENIHLVWGGAKQQETNACDFTNVKKSDYATANTLNYCSIPFIITLNYEISVPLLLGSMHALSDATIVEQNFVDKEWCNQTLSPGQKAQGFVYFNLNGQPDWAKSGSLRIDSLDTRSRQTSTINIPFSHETR
jgi:hypothetical protein